MNGSNSRIVWPHFARRSDFGPGLKSSMQMRVSAIFSSGFDARNADCLMFFTSDTQSLHPLSLLVPASVVDLVFQDCLISLSEGSLSFAAANGRRYDLVETDPVKVPDACSIADLKLIQENLKMLIASLKLFGRRSIILDLVLGCNTEKNILSGAETIIFAANPDLNSLAGFIGAGEGLTPAFDDFLTGMLFVDRFTLINRINMPDDFFANISRRTTVQSLQQLGFAANGKLSLRFESFIGEFMSRNLKSADIVKIINCGHSSGTDILCGIWHYLDQTINRSN